MAKTKTKKKSIKIIVTRKAWRKKEKNWNLAQSCRLVLLVQLDLRLSTCPKRPSPESPSSQRIAASLGSAGRTAREVALLFVLVSSLGLHFVFVLCALTFFFSIFFCRIEIRNSYFLDIVGQLTNQEWVFPVGPHWLVRSRETWTNQEQEWGKNK